MTLKYRILWFEDDEEVINDTIGPSIINYLDDLGFEPEIAHYLDGRDLEQLIRDRNYDLIVTDLNLGEYETGEDLIDHVRRGNILTEVLLYSANTTELGNLIANKGWIERASFSIGLGNLDSKLKEIIYLTVRKNQDVNNTRGLVIAESIDLEKKIEKIILKYFTVVEHEVLSEKKKIILDKIVNKKIIQHKSEIEQIEQINFTEIKTLIDNDILTASNSFDAIVSILNDSLKEVNIELNKGKIEEQLRIALSAQKDEIANLKAELLGFREEILKIRNTLAHVKEEVGDDGIPFLSSLSPNGLAIKFDQAKYIEIRKNLKKHSSNLDKIASHINS